MWLFEDFWNLEKTWKHLPPSAFEDSDGTDEGGAVDDDSEKGGVKTDDSGSGGEKRGKRKGKKKLKFDLEAEDEYDAILGPMWADMKRWVANHPDLTFEEKLVCLGYYPPGHKEGDY